MLFPKRLHQFWPLWRRQRHPHPCRQLRHRQRRMRRHHPHLRPNRSSQNLAQMVMLFPKRRHQSRPIWRRHKRLYPCPQLRPRQHRMRRHHRRLPSNPTVRIRTQVAMRLHQFWPLWRRQRQRHIRCRDSYAIAKAPDEAALPSLAAKSFEPKTASNSDAVSEAPASVVAGLATPQASISLATVTPSSTPPAAAPLSGAPERVDSRANSTDDAVSQVPSSAMAGLTALQASTSLAPAAVSPRPDRAASSEAGENVASDELIQSRPRSSGETVFDAATPSATQEAPASLPPIPASPPNTFAQATPCLRRSSGRNRRPLSSSSAQGSSGGAGEALPLTRFTQQRPSRRDDRHQWACGRVDTDRGSGFGNRRLAIDGGRVARRGGTTTSRFCRCDGTRT